MLVFGGASVNEMLRNWAIHVQKLQVPYAVRPRLRVRLRARV